MCEELTLSLEDRLRAIRAALSALESPLRDAHETTGVISAAWALRELAALQCLAQDGPAPIDLNAPPHPAALEAAALRQTIQAALSYPDGDVRLRTLLQQALATTGQGAGLQRQIEGYRRMLARLAEELRQAQAGPQRASAVAWDEIGGSRGS